MLIAIIDYGAGNLHSVKNALDFLNADSMITDSVEDILNADKIILPGVGAFGDAMASIERKNLAEVIKHSVNNGKPFLGICLGMQLLFSESEESPGIKGLDVLKGKIVKIPDKGLKIPHIGWNNITLEKKSKILTGLGKEPFVYFVHSYYLEANDNSVVSAYTEYGARLSIAVEKNNIFATQFHPEKSGKTGLKILSNFAKL